MLLWIRAEMGRSGERSLTTRSPTQGGANKISHIPNTHQQFPNRLCKWVVCLAAARSLPAPGATVRLADLLGMALFYGPERDLQQTFPPKLSKAPGKPRLSPRGPYLEVLMGIGEIYCARLHEGKRGMVWAAARPAGKPGQRSSTMLC